MLVLLFIKSLFKRFKFFKKSIYKNKIYVDVEFRNCNNIAIGGKSKFERGCLVKANNPDDRTSKNIQIANHCWFGKNVDIQSYYNSTITISDFVTIQDNCKIYGNVSIGKYCILAPDIFISSGNHFFSNEPYLTIREQDKLDGNSSDGFKLNNKPIIIDEDCWIGKNVFIKPGTHIGKGSIIGTNSIVGGFVEPYSVMIGNPAKKIKERLYFSPPFQLDSSNKEHLPYFYSGFIQYDPQANIMDLIQKNDGIRSNSKSTVILGENDNRFIEITGKIRKVGEFHVLVNNEKLKSECISEDSCFKLILDRHHKIQTNISQSNPFFGAFITIDINFIATCSEADYDFSIGKISQYD
jgi:acetyltransferase-like isoleucine patch superfamily enzyme